ncbi:MAG: hypothetical protein OSJ24_05960 [Muribaculaceae bacterium]|nr:hypothetical protein [Muribaculaceae bacterium]
MSKFKYLFLALIAIAVGGGFASYGDEDDEPGKTGSDNVTNVNPGQPSDNNNAALIIGTWSRNGQFIDPEDGNYGYIFRADGTCDLFGSGIEETTYRLSSDGKQLFIYDEYYDEYDSMNIDKLTADKLVLSDPDEDYDWTEVLYRVK